jgi:prefoldin subunit 5
MLARLRLRRLELRVQTTGPECGFDIDFGPGLNILRADNSSGKSTCLQAIIYALGLEGMLSASREVPLPHAMTHVVDVLGTEYSVRSSHVSLEIENGDGQILTIRRAVKGEQIDTRLIETWSGPALTSFGQWPQRDFFVRLPGAAQREAGFQHRLAEFLGWRMPSITKMDGGEAPLYLEALFPYMFVEQKHGWTGIQARIPGYLGLREPGKRAVEFLLRLEAYDRVLTRQRLLSARAVVDADWKARVQSLIAAGETAGVMVRGLPERPAASVTPSQIDLLISNGRDWETLDDAIGRLEEEIDEISSTQVQSVASSVNEAETNLTLSQHALAEAAAQLSHVNEESADVTRRRDGLDLRIESLEEDLKRHRDLGMLQRLGSASLGEMVDSRGICPTCHQELRDGMDISSHAMTVVENIQYIQQQLDTFRAMREDISRVVLALASRGRALRQEVSDLRRTIRALKETLVDVGSSLSSADVRNRLRREDRREDLLKVRGTLHELSSQFAELGARWQQLDARLREFRTDVLGAEDTFKLTALVDSLRDQLQSYKFRSLSPTAIDISPETYRPVHEGFDLGFDLSASDMIRIIWSYLVGLLETSLRYGGRHPGLLVFDEPRQQETARVSFEALLKRTSLIGGADENVQVIFATSEDEYELMRMLKDSPHRLVSLPPGSKIIVPIEEGGGRR